MEISVKKFNIIVFSEMSLLREYYWIPLKFRVAVIQNGYRSIGSILNQKTFPRTG